MFTQMGAVADEMATKTASLLESWDLAEAAEILTMDDQMDRVHRDLFTAVLAPTWPHGVQAAIDTTLMSRYYERYADHAVAIARRVIQLVTGAPFSQTGTTDPASDLPGRGSTDVGPPGLRPGLADTTPRGPLQDCPAALPCGA